MLLVGSNKGTLLMSAAIISEMNDTRTIVTVRTYSHLCSLYSITGFSISTPSF